MALISLRSTVAQCVLGTTTGASAADGAAGGGTRTIVNLPSSTRNDFTASDRTVDRSERKALLARAQAIVADQVPEIPLYTVTRLDAVPATLEHFKGNPTNTGIFWNVHEWEIK